MESKKLEKPCENATFQALQGVMKPDEETGGVFPTMKPLDSDKKAAKPAEAAAEAPAAAPVVEEKIDFSNVQIEPLFQDQVDFDTFSKSDFRAVKDQGMRSCEEVQKALKVRFGRRNRRR